MSDPDVLGLFPAGSRIDGGVLSVGGCRLDELAAEFGTPRSWWSPMMLCGSGPGST